MLGSVGVVAWRRVDNIKSQPECLVHHLRDDATEQRTGQLQARVGVDLNQPGIELAVYHKVQPEDLKVVLEALRR